MICKELVRSHPAQQWGLDEKMARPLPLALALSKLDVSNIDRFGSVFHDLRECGIYAMTLFKFSP